MFCPNPDCPEATDSGSPGEYRAEVLNCPRCGAALAPELSQGSAKFRPELTQEQDRRFVVVGRLDNEPALSIAREMLSEAGIRYFLHDQQSFGPWGGPGGTGILGQAELAVEPERAEEAKLLLARIAEASSLTQEELSETTEHGRWLGRQLHSTPSLAGVVFLSSVSALFLTAVLVSILQSDHVNGVWLFLGVFIGIVALNAEKRRRQADREDRNG